MIDLAKQFVVAIETLFDDSKAHLGRRPRYVAPRTQHILGRMLGHPQLIVHLLGNPLLLGRYCLLLGHNEDPPIRRVVAIGRAISRSIMALWIKAPLS